MLILEPQRKFRREDLDTTPPDASRAGFVEPAVAALGLANREMQRPPTPSEVVTLVRKVFLSPEGAGVDNSDFYLFCANLNQTVVKLVDIRISGKLRDQWLEAELEDLRKELDELGLSKGCYTQILAIFDLYDRVTSTDRKVSQPQYTGKVIKLVNTLADETRQMFRMYGNGAKTPKHWDS